MTNRVEKFLEAKGARLFLNDIRSMRLKDACDKLYSIGGDKLTIAFIYVMSKTFDDSLIFCDRNTFNYDYSISWHFNGDKCLELFGYNSEDYYKELQDVNSDKELYENLKELIYWTLKNDFHFDIIEIDDFVSMIKWSF